MLITPLLLLSLNAQADPTGTSAEAEESCPEEQDEPCEEAGWIELDVPADFDTALAVVQPEDTDDGVQIDDLLPSPRARLRGRWSVSPVLSAAGLADLDWTLAGGVRLGHQWWQLDPGGVRPVGETRLTATLPFSAHGYRLALSSTHGAWVGPVGLLAGPSLRWDRLQWEGAGLPSAWTLGPRLHLAARLGPLTPWISATPGWHLSGDRPPRTPWDELTLGGGLQHQGGTLTLRLAGEWTDTTAGGLWSATAGLHLRLL